MRTKLSLAAVIALFAPLLAGASAASAAPEPGSESPSPAVTHCVLHGVSTAPNGTVTLPTQPGRCFSTLADAASANKVSQAQLDRGMSTASASSSMAAVPTASYMLGLEYRDKNLGGSTLSLYGAGKCGDGVVSNFPSLAGVGFNNTIGSAVSYSGCLSGHWQYDNFGGPSIVCNCYSNLGALNDLTSSIRFSRTGR
jgi:hypothetical protein